MVKMKVGQLISNLLMVRRQLLSSISCLCGVHFSHLALPDWSFLFRIQPIKQSGRTIRRRGNYSAGKWHHAF